LEHGWGGSTTDPPPVQMPRRTSPNLLLCKATGPPKAPAAIMPQPPPPQIAKAVQMPVAITLQAPSPVEVLQQDEVMADLMLSSCGPAQAEVPAVSGTSPAVMPSVMVSSAPAQAEVPAEKVARRQQ
jgi:hypothetical protein